MTSHSWHIATHARPTFCNVCREALSGVTMHGYSCGICKLKAHKSCVSNIVNGCKWITLDSVDDKCIASENGVNFMQHQWIEGNLPVSAKCSVCDKNCGSVIRLQDWRCMWCRSCVHSTCRARFVQHCSLGETRPYTIPPTCLIEKGVSSKIWNVVEPLPGSPMIVFVNCKSGGGHGEKFLRRFKQILNPGQVFDIANEGPTYGLEVYRYLAPLRLLVCGGDGSVGWVLKEIDKLQLKAENVCVSVLPLGTGNDLARVCGWGSAIEDDVHLINLLEKYEVGSPRLLDRWSIMSVESSTACKEDRDLEDPISHSHSSTLMDRTLSQEQRKTLLQQVEQLKQDLDEKLIAACDPLASNSASDVVEKSDYEKLEKHSDSDDVFHLTEEQNVKTIPAPENSHLSHNSKICDCVTDFLSDVENTVDLSSHEILKSHMRNLKELQQKWLKDLDTPLLSNTADNSVDHEPMESIAVERAKEILSQMLLELKPCSAYKEPTILITGVADEEIDLKEDKPEEICNKNALQLTVDIPKISVSSEEDESSSVLLSNSSCENNEFSGSSDQQSRPSSLIAVVRPMSKCSGGDHEDSTFTLDNLPSPNDFQRSGSIVGEPQLPVPTEFRDMQETSDDEEARKYLSPVSGSEAAMRSRARLSSRLRSVPEKHSLLSFVQDIRRKGLESERRVSTAGMMCTTTVPVPIVPLQSSSNKNTLEPGEASSIVVKRRGSRRLSVGALVGLNVTTSAKDDVEVVKKSKAQVASSYGSTPGLTQGGVTRIRNKTIPIINPIVKSSNWNTTASKRDIERSADHGLVSMVVLASADALCAPVTPIMDWTPPPDKMNEKSVMNNYFGIGIDAKISLDFHNKREENPVKSRSRAKNYMLYGVLGSRELVQKTYKNLEKRVIVECDGEPIPLPSLQGIVVLNISSFMGGTNFWGSAKEDNIFLPPSFDDGILEVVAVFGSMHMGASRLVNLQRHRIAQCRSIVIRILGDEGVPVQVDGEAWLHPPGIIRIVHKNRVQLVCRDRAMEQQLKGGAMPRAYYREHAHPVLLPLDEEESHMLRSLIGAAKQLHHHVILIHHALDGRESVELASLAGSLQDAMKTVTSDGIMTLDAPELRRRSAIIVTRLRQCIEVSKRVLLEKFQDTQCDAAGKLSQSIYVVESLLGKCHQEGDLLFFTIRQDPPESGHRRNSWFRVPLPKFGRTRSPSISLLGNSELRSHADGASASTSSMATNASTFSRKLGDSSSCMVEIAVQWSPNEVSQWLEAIGLPMYCHAFLEHEISGTELMSLERSDFKDVGVSKVGHIKKLQKGIRDIQAGKMPRRLLHATCGVTSISSQTSGTSTLSRMTPSPSPKPPIFDDYDSFTIEPMPSREDSSFG